MLLPLVLIWEDDVDADIVNDIDDGGGDDDDDDDDDDEEDLC